MTCVGLSERGSSQSFSQCKTGPGFEIYAVDWSGEYEQIYSNLIINKVKHTAASISSLCMSVFVCDRTVVEHRVIPQTI